MLVDPENGIDFFSSNVGDIMGVPNGHVNEWRIFAIQIKGQRLGCAYPTQFYPGFAFDHCKALGLTCMEMVATGDARDGGWKAYLSPAVEFYGFDEAASMVGIKF